MKWMSVRDFMRGGYRDLTEPTVVSNHGRPVFTVFPHNGGPVIFPADTQYTSSVSTGTSLSATESATLTTGVSSLPERRA